MVLYGVIAIICYFMVHDLYYVISFMIIISNFVQVMINFKLYIFLFETAYFFYFDLHCTRGHWTVLHRDCIREVGVGRRFMGREKV